MIKRTILYTNIRALFYFLLTWATVISLEAGEFGVSPMLFEVELGDRPETQALQVFNFSKEEMTFKVSVATWDLNENNRVRLLEPTEQSLDQWILINPLELKVAPKGKATVRFSIRPRIKPAPGEHRAMIYLTETGSHDIGNIQVQGQFGVAVYGYVGPIQRDGELHGTRVATETNPISAFFDITSKGTAHIRLRAQFAIWPKALYPGADKTEKILGLGKPDTVYPEGVLEVGEVPTTPILPGTRRELQLKTGRQLETGDYILDINGELGGQTVDLALPFTVEVPKEADGEAAAKEEAPR